jgi:hypothetical protein
MILGAPVSDPACLLFFITPGWRLALHFSSQKLFNVFQFRVSSNFLARYSGE